MAAKVERAAVDCERDPDPYLLGSGGAVTRDVVGERDRLAVADRVTTGHLGTREGRGEQYQCRAHEDCSHGRFLPASLIREQAATPLGRNGHQARSNLLP